MNTQILKSALARYHEWAVANNEKFVADIKERQELNEIARSFTKERLLNLSEEELYDLMAPLWAMRMWGNKHYSVNVFIQNNTMPALRKQLANLLYGEEDISIRWDDFRTKIRDIGPAIMSELLCRIHPDKYLLWNRKALNGFQLLEIKVSNPYAGLDGKKYAALCKEGLNILEETRRLGFKEIDNLMTLDYFIWQELQESPIVPVNTAAEESHESKKVKDFVHNEVRDRIRDIGELLGFTASIEKKVADGAVVDAVWEAKIGNMGRVIYVFEVQTSGSIDSLVMNFMKAKKNPAVQGIVAVSDSIQLEKIKKEASLVCPDIKIWDYKDVLNVYDNLSNAFESINTLALVPDGFLGK